MAPAASRRATSVASSLAGARSRLIFDPARVGPHQGGGWRNYVRGVVDELNRAGIAVPGGTLASAGSLARGTGLSSSARLEVALAHALLAAAGYLAATTIRPARTASGTGVSAAP